MPAVSGVTRGLHRMKKTAPRPRRRIRFMGIALMPGLSLLWPQWVTHLLLRSSHEMAGRKQKPSFGHQSSSQQLMRRVRRPILRPKRSSLCSFLAVSSRAAMTCLRQVSHMSTDLQLLQSSAPANPSCVCRMQAWRPWCAPTGIMSELGVLPIQLPLHSSRRPSQFRSFPCCLVSRFPGRPSPSCTMALVHARRQPREWCWREIVAS